MSSTAQSTFEIASWEEKPFDDAANGVRLTRADVGKTYSADIAGTSATVWLMAYADDGSAIYVGLERILGTVCGRDGELVLTHVGEFRDGAATSELTVVGSGGALASATGRGRMVADPAGRVSLDLEVKD